MEPHKMNKIYINLKTPYMAVSKDNSSHVFLDHQKFSHCAENFENKYYCNSPQMIHKGETCQFNILQNEPTTNCNFQAIRNNYELAHVPQTNHWI